MRFYVVETDRLINHIITVELIADLLYTQVKPMDFSQAGPAGGRRVARVEQKAVDVGGLHSQVGLPIHTAMWGWWRPFFRFDFVF